MTTYKTIPDLPAATVATNDDQVEISQGGTSRRLSLGQIVTALPSEAAFVDVRFYGVVLDGVTDTTAAVVSAVAAAFSSGKGLFWPNGTAVTTTSIPNLHQVRHVGPGIIKRGTNTFTVAPLAKFGTGTTNHLYVAPAGNTTNDGLSPSQPMTSQTAVNALPNYGPMLNGTWQIDFAAGENSAFVISYLKSMNAIRFVGVPTGDFRSVPTSMVTKAASGASENGMAFTAYVNVFVKDILVKDFLGSYNAGLLASLHCVVTIENVHATNCDIGWYILDYTLYSAKGGTISYCIQMGVQELFSVVRNYKYAGTATDRTIITNCVWGMHLKELCTGHMDFVEVSDCTYGMMFVRGSTANIGQVDMKRNNIAIVLSGRSMVTNISATSFHAGTADANTIQILPLDPQIIENVSGGGNVEALITAPYVGQSMKVLGYKTVPFTLTGTTVQTKLMFPVGDFLAGEFQAEGSRAYFNASGTCSLVGGTATVAFRTGANIAIFTLPIGTVFWEMEMRFMVPTTGSATQRYVAKCFYGTNTATPASVLYNAFTRTIDFKNLDQPFGVWGQLSVGTDSITADEAVTWTTNS
jgi:hypothetical protein